MSPPLRMGVLGCADIAWRRTLPAFVADPDIDLVAIASRERERASTFTARFGGTPYGSYAEVLDRDDVDAVYIPLPARLHAHWIRRALRAGKHVLAEKPLTDSAAETADVLALARAENLVLLENYMFLHHSQHAWVRDYLDSGVLGAIRQFTSWFTIPPKPPNDIRYQPDVGGGAFLDFGGYPVRAALLFLGPELSPVGAVFRHDRTLDVITSGSVLLTTPAGTTAQLTFGMEHSYRNSYEFACADGRLGNTWVFTPPASHRPVIRTHRQDHTEEVVLAADDQFGNVSRFFARAVRERRSLTEAHRLSQCHADLMAAIHASARICPAEPVYR